MKNVISLGDGKGARFKIIPIFSSYFHHINCCRGSQLPRLACRRIVLSIRSGLAAAASQSPTYLLGYSGGSNTENHTLRQCTHSHTHTILVVVDSYGFAKDTLNVDAPCLILDRTIYVCVGVFAQICLGFLRLPAAQHLRTNHNYEDVQHHNTSAEIRPLATSAYTSIVVHI